MEEREREREEEEGEEAETLILYGWLNANQSIDESAGVNQCNESVSQSVSQSIYIYRMNTTK